MKIGELAHLTGMSIDTVRYYERRGVLPAAARTNSGYRVFGAESVGRLVMVRQLRDLGFTLDEVVDALHAHDRGGATCVSERWRLNQVDERIDAKIKKLQATRRSIRAALAACDNGSCRMTSA